MCFKQISQALGLAPSKRKEAAAVAAQAAAAKASTPARAAEDARDETGALVLETDAGADDIVGTGTDVSVRRSKKAARKGVPGLGL